MKVYLSGPITDSEGYREAFDAAARYLRELGHVVVNPVELDDADGDLVRSWEGYMRRDLTAMLDGCDVIYMLPGWTNSPGARLEHYVAQALDMQRIYNWNEEAA